LAINTANHFYLKGELLVPFVYLKVPAFLTAARDAASRCNQLFVSPIVTFSLSSSKRYILMLTTSRMVKLAPVTSLPGSSAENKDS